MKFDTQTEGLGTWNPNDPCFDWKRPCFGGLTFKNRGHLGSRYIYMHTHHKLYKLSHGNRETMEFPSSVHLHFEELISWMPWRNLQWCIYPVSYPLSCLGITRSTIVDHVNLNHYLDPFVEEFFSGSNHFGQKSREDEVQTHT